jgi:type I restriction enzyme, S subunit
LHEGDILFNRTNSKDLVGKTGLWDGQMQAVAASYFIRVRVSRDRVVPEFLWALMNSAHMKRVLRATARGAIGQANINSTELQNLSIYQPPGDLQRLFAARWKAIRTTISKKEDVTDMDRLFSLLLNRAFSGDLTAKWRDGHMKELLYEMELQARLLNLPSISASEKTL